VEKRWARIAGWLAIVLAAVVIVVLLWPRRDDGPPPSRASAPEAPPVAAAPPAMTVANPPSGGAPPPAPPPDPVAAYRERTRYAPGTGRLHAGAVDLLEPNRRYENPRPIQASLGRPEGEVTYLLDVERFYYTTDEVATIALRVRQGERVVPVSIRRGVAIAEDFAGQGDEEADVQEERLRFAMQDGDPTAELDLARVFPEHHGPVRIVTEFEWEPGELQETSLRIFTTPEGRIPAAFTERDVDYVEDGSLVVEVGLDVFEPGFYRIDANLFGPDGAPLAFGSFTGDLARGEQRAKVRFFGLVLHDQAASGPYEVRNLRGYLFREAAYPDKLQMRDALHTHWTRAYELARFSDEEYTSEHKANMLRMLEADVAAGIAIVAPETPTGSAAPLPGQD
jgi:hypothetical protein